MSPYSHIENKHNAIAHKAKISTHAELEHL
jgi:hypothetical protein